MITKSEIKYIKSLQHKKYRIENKSFVVEGTKIVNELISSDFQIDKVYALADWISTNQPNSNIAEVSERELNSISGLKTANSVVAVAKMKNNLSNSLKANTDLVLALERIQDPGNFGTIIRMADWFGIQNIICSYDSVELYNPKVIQATMGSAFRVTVHYVNLIEYLNTLKNNSDKSIYGALLNGDNIYEKDLIQNSVIVFGNESEGISNELTKILDHKISIPSYSINNIKPESLNVATAASIICAEFKRSFGK